MKLYFFLILVLIGSSVAAQKRPPAQSNYARLAARWRQKPPATAEEFALFLRLLFHEGQFGAIIKAAQTKGAPINRDARLTLAAALIETGRNRQALQRLAALEDPDAPDWRLDFFRARCLVGLKQYDAARKLLGVLLRLRPNHPGVHYYYALTCAPKREWQDAVKHGRLALQHAERDSPTARKAAVVVLAALWKLDQIQNTP